MRVAAGVLLIIMAVVNLFGGFAYTLGGGVMGAGGGFVEQASQQAAMDSATDEERQAAETASEAAGAAKALGGMLMFLAFSSWCWAAWKSPPPSCFSCPRARCS